MEKERRQGKKDNEIIVTLTVCSINNSMVLKKKRK
jgi:hypothetical protein